jgi:hypothetical protein
VPFCSHGYHLLRKKADHKVGSAVEGLPLARLTNGGFADFATVTAMPYE